ncbi:MAG: RNA polymerase sigma factor [Bacteroidota bacterium]|uniref:RNA polymerase sigma factor n=1 Tax=Runella sp. TaxID=1960881 RepID=UPI003015C611
MQSTDITQIVQGCKRRQPASQKELVRRFAGALLSVARRYVRVKSDAEDVLQESFVLIFKKIDQFDMEKGSISTWMRRIVIHCALAQYRKFRYTHETTSETMPEAQDSEPNVFSKLSYDELMRLIDALPDGPRAVFNMAVFDEFSHEEIAEALGIPAGTSRSWLSRARKLLQQQILNLQSHELAGI